MFFAPRYTFHILSALQIGIVQMNILMLMSLLLPIVSIRETGMALSKE